MDEKIGTFKRKEVFANMIKNKAILVVVLVLFLGAMVIATPAKADNNLLSEEELFKAISATVTVGDISYVPLESYYYDQKEGHKKILQILNKFMEIKKVEIKYFYLDKDYNSTYLSGIYIIHNPKF